MKMERELTRVKYFLRFGTELSVIHFTRKSSFLAFLREEDKKSKKRLKSLENIFKFSQNSREKEIELKSRIETLVLSEKRLFSHSFPLLLVSLFECQSSRDNNQEQSQFRQLAIQLLSRDICQSKDILMFCHVIGREKINSSRRIRKALNGFYSRDFNESQIQEMLLIQKKFSKYSKILFFINY